MKPPTKKSLWRAAVGVPVLSLALLALPGTAQATTAVRAASGTSVQAPAAALVTKLTHSQATSRFRAAGITWSSSGGCSDRNNPTCTSFEQINLATVQGAETLKSASGCAIHITGGTETGHASGTYSHWNGYKLDYRLSTCLDNYITSRFAYIGGNKYQSGSGNIYFRESNHWDVTYYNCGGC
ncbi:hypothetical protein [Streptomyces megasporus]|uniref:hypothetical protein n=1 Tax=Streptomyces megasporus TaxID=44060 RepID=UPI000689DBA5|nr:hypothetical protein [Streptomyces megasporus]